MRLGIGEFQIEVLDPKFHELEIALWNVVNRQQTDGSPAMAKFRYGVTWGQNNFLTSPWFYNSVLSYTPRWTYNGVILTVTGKTTQPKNDETRDRAYRDMNINQIVEHICAEQGWKLEVNEECKEIHVPEYLDRSQPAHKHFQATAMTPVQFIRRYLCPYAQRKKDGKVGYVFWLDDRTNPPTAYFKIPEPSDKPPPVKTFTIRKDRREEWIDFSYEVDIQLGTITSVFDVRHRTVPAYNGHIRFDYYNSLDRSEIPNIEEKKIGREPVTEPNRSTRVNDHRQKTEQEIELTALHELAVNNTQHFSATLTILGDPELDVKPGDHIQILNYLPDGALHYSSGIYRVKEVTNAIQGGEFTTTYTLVRNNAPNIPTPETNVKAVA